MNKNVSHELLGQLLLKAGIVNESTVDKALLIHEITGEPLGKVFTTDFNVAPEKINQAINFQKFQEKNKAELVNGKIGQLFKKIGLINQKQIDHILEKQKSDNKLFGQIMLEKKIVSKSLLNNIIEASSGNEKSLEQLKNKKIGELLIDLNYTSTEKITDCLASQKQTRKKVGEIALEKGYVVKKQLNKAVSLQKKLASLFMVTLVSTNLLAGCGGPRVGNFATVENYSASTAVKSLSNQSGNVTYYKDGTVSVSNIPYYQQGNNNTCAQSVMTSILNYWGIELTYQTVVNQTNSWNIFTDVGTITKYIRQKGVYAQDYRMASSSFIKDRIRKGLPAIVLLDFGSVGAEHYVIVRGYNDNDGEFIILDPVDGPNVKMKYDIFEKMWENRSLRSMGIFGDKYNRIVFDIGGN